MWRYLIKFLTPITYAGDDNKTRSAQSVHWISLVFMAGIILYIGFTKYFSASGALNIFDFILFVILLVLLAVWALTRYGYVRQAGVILAAFLWFAVNATAFIGFGVRDPAFIGNFVALLATGLLIGWRAAVAFSVLTIAAGFGLAYAEVNGISRTFDYFTSPYTTLQDMAIIFVVFAVMMAYLISSLENAVRRSLTDAKQLESANRDLNLVRIRLEENRSELIVANEQLKRRAERINSIANVSKTITVVQEIDRLLLTVVGAVSERFRYLHVAIYLLDETKQSAILSACSSEEGKQKLQSGFRIKVGSEGIVGLVTERGEARIGAPAEVRVSNPNVFELLDARSQLVLPLKVKEIVIGALDIQSSQPDAFNHEDISTLRILADQVTIAIQNARSADRARNALLQAEIASQQLVGRGWRQYAGSLDRKGYRYDGIKSEPVKDSPATIESKNSANIPVRLRGQVIGRLRLNPSDGSRQWTEDEIAMVEATAERVALALENARLLENAQSRAQRETFLGELSSKLGASYQLDSILRDTVEELGQTIRNSTVSFQLVNPSASAESYLPTNEGSRSDNGKDSSQP